MNVMDEKDRGRLMLLLERIILSPDSFEAAIDSYGKGGMAEMSPEMRVAAEAVRERLRKDFHPESFRIIAELLVHPFSKIRDRAHELAALYVVAARLLRDDRPDIRFAGALMIDTITLNYAGSDPKNAKFKTFLGLLKDCYDAPSAR